MQIEKLEYFTEVARTGSINLASQHLNISHQALNQSMHLLEQELGVKLFQSSNKGIILTEQGEKVYYAALEIVHGWKRLKEDLREESSYAAQIHIALAPHMESLYYTKVYAYMQKNYPNITINMTAAYLQEAFCLMENGEVDLSIISYPKKAIEESCQNHSELEYIFLQQIKTGILVNRNNPLAQYETVSYEQIKSYPIAFSKTGDVTKNFLFNDAQQNGCNNILLVHSEELLQPMVANDIAITFFSSVASVKKEYRNKVVQIALQNDLQVTIGALVHRSRKEEKEIKCVLQALRAK